MNKQFRFTAERRDLLQRFVQYRYLRMSHVYGLYGAGTRMTSRGLRRLVHDFWAKGYLYRNIAPANPTCPQRVMEFAYWLSRKGVALAEEAGMTSTALPLTRRSIDRTLGHELAITDFHLSADKAVSSVRLTLVWEQYGLRRGVNPDALVAVTDPAKPADAGTSYNFLEIERSRQGGYDAGQSVLLRRLNRYAAYQGSEECQLDWQWFNEFRVLIVVTSEARRRRLLETLAPSLPLPMFWICVSGTDLAVPDFLTPADQGAKRHSLAD